MITIFTPTYNRAYILPNLYDSLNKQSNKNFEWLIIDDGSSDDTEILINKWSKKTDLNIRFYKQNNHGKHTAINNGLKRAKGDLFFIVDSDDILSENAIQILLEKYDLIKNDINISGIAIACRYINNHQKTFLNKKLPSDILINYNDLTYKLGISGEFATAFKTEVQKLYPYPVFKGENFMRESIVYRRIGKKYKTLYIDDPLYFAEYLHDGLTMKSWKMLKLNPKGASLFFKELSNEKIPIKNRLSALNSYWDFQINDIKSSFIYKFKGVSFVLSLIVLFNRKIKFLKL